jgi:hypothetical protein
MDDPQDCKPTEVGSKDDGRASLRVIKRGSVWMGASAEHVGSRSGLRMEPETLVSVRLATRADQGMGQSALGLSLA